MFIARNNNPDGSGSGLLNGDPTMRQYVQSGTLSLKGLRAVLLLTDGMPPLGWDMNHEATRQRMLTTVLRGGFEELISIKREAEDADPGWRRLRYKHSDDATGLLITNAAN